jgi:hypothetical protein
MNRSKMLSILMVLGLVAGTFMMVMPAQAKVAIGTANGWEFSTDGWINAFAVFEDADDTINGGVSGMTHSGFALLQGEQPNNKSFRVRTGLLPCLLAFNIKAPTVNGIDLAARVGFYPQIQDPDQSRLNNQDAVLNGEHANLDFGSSIDLREAFLTADGAFGQVLAGRALHLFQGKSVLNDMTLFGMGTQGGSAGGTTYGYIGFGYVYTNFGSQIRYTTPDMAGVKVAIGVLDPATISSSDIAHNYSIVESPGYEAEISYAGEVASGVKLQAWVNGMTQDAKRNTTGTETKSVTASGFSGGVTLDVAGIHAVATGFSGSGIGSAFMMALDAVDSNDDERDIKGYMGSVAYTIMGTTKIGIQYGANDVDETTADRDARTNTATSQIDKRSAYTLGVYHDITPNWKVMAEYTKAKVEWFDGADRESATYGIGTFFLW